MIVGTKLQWPYGTHFYVAVTPAPEMPRIAAAMNDICGSTALTWQSQYWNDAMLRIAVQLGASPESVTVLKANEHGAYRADIYIRSWDHLYHELLHAIIDASHEETHPNRGWQWAPHMVGAIHGEQPKRHEQWGEYLWTQYDPLSVMHLPIGPHQTIPSIDAPRRTQLSAIDRDAIRAIHPPRSYRAWLTAMFADYLEREPQLADFWYHARISKAQTVAAVVASEEYRRTWITESYHALLSREPDAGGLAYWIAQPLTMAQVIEQFVLSDEYQRLAERQAA